MLFTVPSADDESNKEAGLELEIPLEVNLDPHSCIAVT